MKYEKMPLPLEFKTKGWIVRTPSPGEDSKPVLVRGARRNGDGYCETKKGFVYAYSISEAREYDEKHKYLDSSHEI